MNTPATRRAIRFCARISAHISASLAASFVLLAAPPAAAQPVNDACAAAIPITLQTVAFDLSTATTDGPGDCSITRDIWYRFTPARTGVYLATTCESGSPADTVIVVSTDNCAAPTLIGCNDQACLNLSRIKFSAQAGVPVLIRVGLWVNATNSGAGSLTISNADSSPTAFTYQGRLERDGVPYTGSADLRFELTNSRDAFGPSFAQDEVAGIQVVDGVFTTRVDFGDVFRQTSPRFVRVLVRTNPTGAFTTLIPTQPLSVTPYAAFAARAESATTATTATTAATATTATTATTAQSVPWTGITGIPPSLADGVDNEGPWTFGIGATQFSGGRVVIGTDTGNALVNIYDATESNMFFLRSDNSFGTTALIRNGNSNATFAAIVTGSTGPFGSGNLVLRDVSGNADRLVIDAIGRFGINTAPVAGRVINVNGGAHCTGTNWVNASSRDFKTDFQPLDHADILRKVTDLPITSWSYRRDHAPFADPASPLARHIGPTAEDFADAFGLGADRTGISTVDQSGVALAAIQALAKENAELRARLDRLERLLEAATPATPATTTP